MKYIILVVFSLFAIFAILWVRSSVISLEYRLSSLEEKKKEMLNEKRLLLAEKAYLSSFVRINSNDQIFVFPDRQKIVYIFETPENLVKTAGFNKKH
ncbi:MAG: hypothetical protein NZ845_04720 [Thermodesulfovibrio sp.]|nr:hypothetical protein [Thermodesulfovibrio sp.]MDW7973097.1 hypothetical protein [Thermodesulfovibrio sp.]